MNLEHLDLFLTIVEKGSMAAAGRELGLSATTVSERLAALESHYGVTLLNRTTRTLGLTDEGRTLFDGARGVLEEARDLESRVRSGAETLSGRIRIGAPLDLDLRTLLPEDGPLLLEETLLPDLVQLGGEKLTEGRVHRCLLISGRGAGPRSPGTAPNRSR